MMNVKITGTNRVAQQIIALERGLDGELKKIVAGTALVAESEAKRLVQRGPKTGRVYVRRGIAHQASAPGEAPATDKGSLVRSIGHSISANGLSASIFAGTKHAKWLELGTRTIKRRPFMRPAAKKARRYAREKMTAIRQKIRAIL